MNELEQKATEALKRVIDPEIGMNVIDGKMIFDLKAEGKSIHLKFRPTSPLCPIAMKLAVDIKKAIVETKLFDKIYIQVVDHVMMNQINAGINL